MSIMPEGGWIDPPQQDAQQRPDYPPQSSYTPRSSYLTCKICDHGTLYSKTVFRMSGPVVAIGFILLIPSIIGMLFSGLMFFGVNALTRGESVTGSALNHESQALEGKYSNYIVTTSMFDLMPASLKGANRATFVARLETVVPIVFDGRYYFGEGCMAHECGMNEAAWVIDTTTNKGTAVIMKYIPDVEGMSSHENFELYGATMDNLPPPLAAWATKQGMTEMNVVSDMFNSTDAPHQSSDNAVASIARFIGSGFAIALGIASFVGGLLGWLLVMRKRVLQCNVCGAVVNAS